MSYNQIIEALKDLETHTLGRLRSLLSNARFARFFCSLGDQAYCERKRTTNAHREHSKALLMQLKPTTQLGAHFCLQAACWRANAVLEGRGWMLRNAHGLLWRLIPEGQCVHVLGTLQPA